MSKSARPISKSVPGVRQRQRADGSWRVWWEPNGPQRAAGMEPVDLDASRPTWSEREADKLNRRAMAATKGENFQPLPGGRSMSALINAYKRDPAYLDKKPATRASYDRNLRLIDRKWGSHSVTLFTKPVMREWYLTLRANSGETQAVRLVAMCSILFSFAELKGWRPEGSNPCLRLKMKIPAPRSRVATWAEFDALIDTADQLGLPSVALACMMSALQGQRRADILQAAPQDFRQVTISRDGEQLQVWAWRVDRSKRGTLGMMPVHPLVEPRLVPRLTAGQAGPIIRNDRTGAPHDGYSFADHFELVRETAAKTKRSLTGVGDQLQFLDLRRTFAVWSRAGGASDNDVGDVLGNSVARDPRLEETYMPASFDTASRAVLSIVPPTRGRNKKQA